jgi:hypothetical protein
MRLRHPGIIIVAICVCMRAAVAAADNGADYYPFHEGASWNYSAHVNGRPGSMIIRVASVQGVAGRQAAILETLVNGAVTASECVGKSDDGLFRINTNGSVIKPPLQILRLPVRGSDTWSSDAIASGQKFKADSTQVVQKVVVPAGTFNAVVVSTNATTPEGTMGNKQWFVAGVGLVKQEVQLPGILILAELTQYDLGK